MTFRELLARVRETALGAYAHQDVPFEQLVDALQPERDLSRTPLFQVMLVVQEEQRSALVLPGLAFRPLEVESRTAKFDLTLSATDTAEGLETSLEYNTDLFDAATTARMLEHLRVLLEGAVAHPAQRVDLLPLLPEAERHKLVREWNGARAGFPSDFTLHGLFEAQVAATPDAIAVTFEEERLTYRALNARANRLAHRLLALGVGPESLVGLCVERSVDMVVGLLGILKAGGAYVPLDPAYPKDRLAFMVEDTRVPVLLAQAAVADKLPRHQATVLLPGWSGRLRRRSSRSRIRARRAGTSRTSSTPRAPPAGPRAC